MDTFVCQANTNGTGYFFFEVSRLMQLDIDPGCFVDANKIFYLVVLRRALEGCSVRRCRGLVGSLQLRVSLCRFSLHTTLNLSHLPFLAGRSRIFKFRTAILIKCAHPHSSLPDLFRSLLNGNWKLDMTRTLFGITTTTLWNIATPSPRLPYPSVIYLIGYLVTQTCFFLVTFVRYYT